MRPARHARKSGSSPAPAPFSDQLLSVLMELSFARKIDQVSAVVRRSVRQMTGADGVTFVLKDRDECFYADEDAIRPLWKGRRFPLSRCISGWVMTNRQTAIIPDIYLDDRVPHDAYRPTFVQSLMMVPIRQEDPVAAIGVYWAHRHEATASEQQMVQAIANGAALAMANVQLVLDLEHAAESERAARLVAERANELTDEFLSTVSHELRTPLGVIQGWLWQLRQQNVEPEMLRHGLAVVERNAVLQARLVEDLIDASRAIAGSIHLRRTTVDVNGVCTVVVAAQRSAAAAKGIELTLRTDAAPVFVHGDLDRLQQIVWNLVDNAIKFTPAGGSIEVTATRASGLAVVNVRDTGIGLTNDVVPHVFERFWKKDSGPTREASGLGLGLLIVHELVKLHGGRVRVDSPGEGLGTTMTVELEIATLRERADAAHGG
jgi:signal transduction histidine kinase